MRLEPILHVIPRDYPRIQRVRSFEELVATPFANGVNALCWERTLDGDFAEVMRLLQPGKEPGINALDEVELRALPASQAGSRAIEAMLLDQQRLLNHGLQPELNCIVGKERDEAVDGGLYRRDVSSFHVDSATVEADTYLCTYLGASSEGLRQEDAMRHVDVPQTRKALLDLYGGPDDEGFLEYLNEHFYDLHYIARPGAKPFLFGTFHLWRIATEHPGCPVPPCVHRAPETLPGDAPRLLLIS